MLTQRQQSDSPEEDKQGFSLTAGTLLVRRMNIGTRLSLVLGLLLALTLIIATVAYNSLNAGQQAVEEIIYGDGRIADDAQQAQIAMLQVRRAEKDYLLRFKQLGFIQARKTYVQRLENQVGKILLLLDDLDLHAVETSALRQILKHYQARFLDVVALHEKRGYIDSGLEGKFRVAAHAIEADIGEYHPKLLNVLLQMRRHEKDYLLRSQSKYIELLHQRSKELKAEFAFDARMLTLTDAYVLTFNQLVAVDKQIIAGVAAFRKSIHQLEPEFDKLIKRGEVSSAWVTDNMQLVAVRGKQWVLLVSALSLLVGLVAAFWLARSITRPVDDIANVVEKFAAGDLTQRVSVSGNDEVSDLAIAFNHMADELQRSIQDMEQFSYVASHDLQEPLRMVASYTELLAKRYEGQIDARADRYIHYASDGAKRMQMLIDALLIYSRAGTQGGELTLIKTSSVVQNAIKNLEIAIRDSGAKVSMGNLPNVSANQVQLLQVLQNVIGNAIKYRGDRKPKIHISATRRGDSVQFSIADNGIGIDPQFHERIFQIFQRLHQRGEYEGTGLGLALVKKIVERHGGHVWLESMAGEGAVFHFTFPAAE